MVVAVALAGAAWWTTACQNKGPGMPSEADSSESSGGKVVALATPSPVFPSPGQVPTNPSPGQVPTNPSPGQVPTAPSPGQVPTNPSPGQVPTSPSPGQVPTDPSPGPGQPPGPQPTPDPGPFPGPGPTPTPSASPSPAGCAGQIFTFESTDVPKPILPLTSDATSQLVVSNVTGVVCRITVEVGLTFPDVDVVALDLFKTGTIGSTLLALGNRREGVTGGAFGSCANRTIFDSESTRPLSDGTPPYADVFRVRNVNISQFLTSQGANGTFSLRVNISTSPDSGTLNCWRMRIQTGNTPIPEFADEPVVGERGTHIPR